MIIIQKRYYREDIIQNPWLTYIYGDNDTRQGTGGQALACRGLPNTLGVRTKKTPSMHADAFYSDSDYADNIRKIGEDLDAIEALLQKRHIVVFPADGVGTGFAQLRNKAPSTFIYLNNRLVTLIDKYRVPDDDLDALVIALNPTTHTIVPNRISLNTIEALSTQAREFLRGHGVVVDIDPRFMQLMVRQIIKRALSRNPFNIQDPLGKEADFD